MLQSRSLCFHGTFECTIATMDAYSRTEQQVPPHLMKADLVILAEHIETTNQLRTLLQVCSPALHVFCDALVRAIAFHVRLAASPKSCLSTTKRSRSCSQRSSCFGAYFPKVTLEYQRELDALKRPGKKAVSCVVRRGFFAGDQFS